jgi:hypothetical protein
MRDILLLLLVEFKIISELDLDMWVGMGWDWKSEVNVPSMPILTGYSCAIFIMS